MKIFLFSLILFFSIFSVVQAQNLQEEKAAELLNRYQELKRFNGAALVARNQKVVFTKGVGMADYEYNIPIDPRTKFCVAGLTEQFTAYIALKVFKQQGLSPDSPVQDFLQESTFNQLGSVTLHHLLSHTSGLPDFPLMHELPRQQVFSKKDLVRYLENINPESQPGAGFMHSKLNYTLLGLVLEKVTAKPFGQLLKEYVTTPIGMKNTSLDNFSRLEMNRAKGYLRREYEGGWENAPYLHPSNTFSAQGILSTTEDLLLWHTYFRKNYLKDKALQRMLTTGYGLQVKRDVTIQILVEGSKVYVNDGMRPKFEVFPQSENQFFVEGTDAEIVFLKNDKGEVTRIGLRNDGFTNGFAEKVKN